MKKSVKRPTVNVNLRLKKEKESLPIKFLFNRHVYTFRYGYFLFYSIVRHRLIKLGLFRGCWRMKESFNLTPRLYTPTQDLKRCNVCLESSWELHFNYLLNTSDSFVISDFLYKSVSVFVKSRYICSSPQEKFIVNKIVFPFGTEQNSDRCKHTLPKTYFYLL